MKKKTPYDIIKSRYVTEKTGVLQGLQHSESNACTRKCNLPKYVFLVDKRSNKREIAEAVEEIYVGKSITVTAVNTITIKPKRRRVRGRQGFKAGFKKAVVTLSPGDAIDENV